MDLSKILIVDDDENNRQVLRDALDDNASLFLEAADGVSAIEVAAREEPDVILLDILMPGMDGLATLHQLKNDYTTRRIPVIMVTALSLDAEISTCLEEGAIDYVTKPFSSSLIRSRVHAALHSCGLETMPQSAAPFCCPKKDIAGLAGLNSNDVNEERSSD